MPVHAHPTTTNRAAILGANPQVAKLRAAREAASSSKKSSSSTSKKKKSTEAEKPASAKQGHRLLFAQHFSQEDSQDPSSQPSGGDRTVGLEVEASTGDTATKPTAAAAAGDAPTALDEQAGESGASGEEGEPPSIAVDSPFANPPTANAGGGAASSATGGGAASQGTTGGTGASGQTTDSTGAGGENNGDGGRASNDGSTNPGTASATGGSGDGGSPGDEDDEDEPQEAPRALVEPRFYTEEELRQGDIRLQTLTAADRMLIQVYGDTIHANDGTHLDGGVGVANDRAWQRRYLKVIAGPHQFYRLPRGKVGNRFLDILLSEWKGCRERKWNSERPLCFPACILRKLQGVKKSAREIRDILSHNMDAWEAGRFDTLVAAVEQQWRRGDGHQPSTTEEQLDSLGRRYNHMVQEGKLKEAVRMITEREGGSLYRPDDNDTKTGKPVLEVLQSKHPNAVIPTVDHFDTYQNEPSSMGVFCYEEQVATNASRMRGASGPSSLDGFTLKGWLLRWGVRSERLREEMAEWVVLLSNGSPEYAMYRAANTARMLAADKEPGVRPLACGEIYMRLWGKCNLASETKELARDACGNHQLCGGLKAGIEGNLHAVRGIWPESAGWTFDRGTSDQPSDVFQQLLDGAEHEAAMLEAADCYDDSELSGEDDGAKGEEEDPGAAEFTKHADYKPDTGFGSLLIDARNAFNEINRYLMLWTTFHRWNRGSRFAFNRYRHHNIVYVRSNPGHPPHIIHSREGVAQGCVFGMFLYGIGLLPLCEQMREEVPESLQTPGIQQALHSVTYCALWAAVVAGEVNASAFASSPSYRMAETPSLSSESTEVVCECLR